MLRPRAFGKITIAVLLIVCLLVSLLFAIEADSGDTYKAFRAITYAIMALTFATVYRYFED
ncbi:MAG: hypothetical protein ACYS1C_01510 [Planctomycetota bacterium]|jgi:hypothetical protein